jgi:hypothetical protein
MSGRLPSQGNFRPLFEDEHRQEGLFGAQFTRIRRLTWLNGTSGESSVADTHMGTGIFCLSGSGLQSKDRLEACRHGALRDQQERFPEGTATILASRSQHSS